MKINIVRLGFGAAALMVSVMTAGAGEVIAVKPGDSLVAARDAARKAKKPVVVELADGVYPIDATLKFGPEDSGTVWRAAKGAKPVISGAIAIDGWKDDGGGSWSAPLPNGADGKPAYFDQLWINGRRAARSVWPKDRWLAVANPWLETVTNDTVESYVQHVDILSEDVIGGDPIAAASKADLEFMQLRVVHQWTFARCNIKDYIAKNRQVVSYTDLKWPWYNYWSTMKTVISFENVRAAFTAPGDWFYDAPAGRVRCRPFKDEKIADARASREGLTQLVEIRGTRQAPVRDLKFRGIAFEGSAVTPLKPGLRGPNESIQYQAACFSDAAVLVDHAERIDFTGCAVRHTGNYAIDFRDGSFDCTVERCRFEDLGAGGVRMGSREQHVTAAEGGRPARRLILERHPDSVSGITLVDSVVNRYGEMNPEAVGVSVMYASDCKVLHNDIGDGFYSGVSVGWTWGYSGSVAQRNEVAFNHVHDLGKALMSDMAGVYTLGTSYGTRVHDNVVHDIDIRDYGGPGLYADEGSEGVIFERNLCYNTETLCTQNYGTGCIYRNNIFAFPKKPAGHAVLLVAAVDDNVPSSLHIVNNIFLTDGVPMVLQTRGDVEGIRMNNVWWNMAGPCKGEFDGLDWKTWLELDRERNSVYADPKFVDAKKFDFRLQPDSPALALGFKPFDVTSVGPRK